MNKTMAETSAEERIKDGSSGLCPKTLKKNTRYHKWEIEVGVVGLGAQEVRTSCRLDLLSTKSSTYLLTTQQLHYRFQPTLLTMALMVRCFDCRFALLDILT